MWLARKAFYRNLLVNNAGNVPANRPVILASNHPNAFMDPIMVALNFSHQVYYLARGDVFNTPLKKWALGSMNILPIFRKEDGDNNHVKNELTFQICNGLFKKGKTIIIYPEGYCVQEKKLRKLKKGTLRMAFGAEEDNNFELGLIIVPCGVNYDNPNKFRSDLVINIGEPIVINEYKEQFLQNENKTITDLTRKLEQAMSKEVLIIKHRELEPFCKDIETLYAEEIAYRLNLDTRNTQQLFDIRKKIANAVNAAADAEDVALADLKSDLKNYFAQVSKYRLRDFLINENEEQKKYFLLPYYLLLLAGFPVFITGCLFNYFPFTYPKKLAKKTAKNIEFYSSVLIGSGAIIFTLYYLFFLAISLILVQGLLLKLLFMVSIPLSGILSWKYYKLYKKTKGKEAFNKLLKNDKKNLDSLYSMRAELYKRVEDFYLKYSQDIR